MIYDLMMSPVEQAGLRAMRKGLVSGLRGRILEVGAGTGLNFGLYREAEEVIAVDPDPGMLGRAALRARQASVPIQVVRARAEDLPFPDGSFDTVVAAFAFCTVDRPNRGLREVRRVLKEGGDLRLLEHVRSPHAAVARLQDLVTPPWSAVLAGCRPNRDTLRAVKNAGFRVSAVRSHLQGLVVEIYGSA